MARNYSLPENMVSIAQVVERRIVVPVVAGSNPVTHPYKYAGVAELADALDLGSSALRRGGSIPFTRIFLNSICHFICGCSSVGRV